MTVLSPERGRLQLVSPLELPEVIGHDETNRHHILFEKDPWKAIPQTAQLRSHVTLVPRMVKNVHNALHERVRPIPPLNRHMASFVLDKYVGTPGDALSSIDELSECITRFNYERRSDRLERELGRLVISHLNAQRPFIAEGVV